MKINSRAILVLASALTLILLLLQTRLPLLFVLLASEMGAVLCMIGLWLVFREIKANGLRPYFIAASVFLLLLGARFIFVGFQNWPQAGITG